MEQVCQKRSLKRYRRPAPGFSHGDGIGWDRFLEFNFQVFVPSSSTRRCMVFPHQTPRSAEFGPDIVHEHPLPRCFLINHLSTLPTKWSNAYTACSSIINKNMYMIIEYNSPLRPSYHDICYSNVMFNYIHVDIYLSGEASRFPVLPSEIILWDARWMWPGSGLPFTSIEQEYQRLQFPRWIYV